MIPVICPVVLITVAELLFCAAPMLENPPAVREDEVACIVVEDVVDNGADWATVAATLPELGVVPVI